MPLRIRPRGNRGGALIISGTLRLASGERVRVERRAQSDDPRLAAEEAAVLEARILREDWHGERLGARSVAAAFLAYFEEQPRSDASKVIYTRVMRALGDRPLSSIAPETVTEVARRVIGPNASVANVNRQILNPLRAVMRLAADRGWVRPIRFRPGREPQGRTVYLLPSEVERLLDAAASHLRSIILFLVCTGARVSEALELEWRDVDLIGARAILWRTKSGRRRDVQLPPRLVVQLSSMFQRDGRVFRAPNGLPYTDHERRSGGQFKTAWHGAVRRAGLDLRLRPHDLRHCWASWHYALHRDPILLKQDGGWSDLKLVERYAHLMPAGHEDEIRRFLGLSSTRAAYNVAP